MPQALREIPEGVMSLLSTTVSAFALLTTFIILKYIFELEFICSCSGGPHHFENMFIVMPPFLLHVLLRLFKNKIYYNAFKFGRSCEETCTSWWFCHQCFQIVSVWSLWLVAVFMDGDWYVCYRANRDDDHRNIPCTHKDHLTTNDTIVVNSWKETSIGIGLGLAIFCALLWAALVCFRTTYCKAEEKTGEISRENDEENQESAASHHNQGYQSENCTWE